MRDLPRAGVEGEGSELPDPVRRRVRTNRYRITPEMRERFTDIFSRLTSGIGHHRDTISFATTQVLVNVTVKKRARQMVSTLDRRAFTLLEDDGSRSGGIFGETRQCRRRGVDVSGSVVEKTSIVIATPRSIWPIV